MKSKITFFIFCIKALTQFVMAGDNDGTCALTDCRGYSAEGCSNETLLDPEGEGYQDLYKELTTNYTQVLNAMYDFCVAGELTGFKAMERAAGVKAICD